MTRHEEQPSKTTPMHLTDGTLSDCNRRLAAAMDAIKAAEERLRQGGPDASGEAAEMLLRAVREGRKVQSVFWDLAGAAHCPAAGE